MKTYKNPLLSFIVNVITLITRQVYLAVAITLIALFPAKKLKLTAPLEPSNIKDSHKSFSVSTQDIITRVRQLTNSYGSNMWLDRSEYEDELLEVYELERLYDDHSYVDYDDMAYSYKAEGRWNNDEIWLMLKDEFYQLQEEYKETRKSLTLLLNRLRLKVLNRSYCSLYYWPYSRYSSTFSSPYTSEFTLTDQGIEEEKLRAHQQINSFNYNHMLFINSSTLLSIIALITNNRKT